MWSLSNALLFHAHVTIFIALSVFIPESEKKNGRNNHSLKLSYICIGIWREQTSDDGRVAWAGERRREDILLHFIY